MIYNNIPEDIACVLWEIPSVCEILNNVNGGRPFIGPSFETHTTDSRIIVEVDSHNIPFAIQRFTPQRYYLYARTKGFNCWSISCMDNL